MSRSPKFWISGYRLMWMIVLFDLPTNEPQERRAAAKFRHFLLDEGFAMGQFSVYYKILSGKEAVEQCSNRIEKSAPQKGLIQIITITDKQYGNIKTIMGCKKIEQKSPEQLQLF